MKKIKILLVLLAFVVSVSLYGCGGETQLDTPFDVEISGKNLRWSTVEQTSSYVVDIDGTEYPAALAVHYHDQINFSLEFLTEIKTYSIKIKAKGDGKKFIDSDFSQEVKFSYYSNGLEFLPTSRLSAEAEDDYSEYGVVRASIEADVDVVVPAFYNGKPVTTIWPGGFSDFSIMESIVIPEGIKSIENNAFDHCYGLRSIIIPSTVEKIGEMAFRSCNMTIYVRGYSKAPSGWHPDSHIENCTIVWNYND